jgi:hypothetical protein
VLLAGAFQDACLSTAAAAGVGFVALRLAIEEAVGVVAGEAAAGLLLPPAAALAAAASLFFRMISAKPPPFPPPADPPPSIAAIPAPLLAMLPAGAPPPPPPLELLAFGASATVPAFGATDLSMVVAFFSFAPP